MHIDKVMKQGRDTIVDQNAANQVAQITQQIVRPFDADLVNQTRGKLRRKEKGIDRQKNYSNKWKSKEERY